MTHHAKTPVVFVRDGAVFANSRDVASYFEKNHRDVLRDVDNVLKNIDCAKLRSGLFQQVMLPDAQGIGRRAFAGTPWAEDWSLALLSVPGARPAPDLLEGFDRKRRAVLVPWETVEGVLADGT